MAPSCGLGPVVLLCSFVTVSNFASRDRCFTFGQGARRATDSAVHLPDYWPAVIHERIQKYPSPHKLGMAHRCLGAPTVVVRKSSLQHEQCFDAADRFRHVAADV